MSGTPRLRTLRLDLEPVRPEHADEVWGQIDDARMWRYFEEQRPATVDALRRRYQNWERGSTADGQIWLNWVCRERSTGIVIGGVQATVFTQERFSYIAYGVYPQYQRKGYAQEAALAIIAHVRETHGIARFVALMDKRNEASYRLAESLGFARVDTRGQDYVYELRL